MKRILTILLTLVLLLALCVPAFAFDVVLSTQLLTVDGKPIDCERYNIDGYNYFKLRDLAWVLNGTGSQFDVDYDAAAGTMIVTTGCPYTHPNGTELKLGADMSATAVPSPQSIRIDGKARSDLSAFNIGNSNYFKLADLGAALGFDVRYDTPSRTMIVESRGGNPAPAPADTGETVTYQNTQIAGITAQIVTVNIKNPRVHLRAAMVNDTVAAREPFADIVAHSGGAMAVITANFMNGDSGGNYPVGHFMSDGQMRYIGSGLTTLGITADGQVRFGRPSIRVRMKPAGGDSNMYIAIGMNLKEYEQEAQFSVLYTPAFGTQFEVTCPGSVTTVRGGSVASYAAVQDGDVVPIPADGYVLWLSDTYMKEFVWQFRAPAVGERMTLEPFVYGSDPEGFSLDGVTQIIAGGPRLLKNGAECTESDAQFDNERFEDDFPSSRTAVGVTADGKLVFLTTYATIPQLRAAFLALGCVNAVNLDGGASTGLYYDGAVRCWPGQPLATTVQIYVDQ